MRKPLGRIALLSLSALLGGVVALPAPAGAANSTYVIRVGDDLSLGKGKDVEVMRFFPRTIDVQAGDTLTFKSFFHTASALPVGTDLQDWINHNADQPGQPYSFITPDKDGPENGWAINDNVFLPSDSSCGTQQNPCTYDGSALVNSGALFQYVDFSKKPPVNNGFSMTISNKLHPGDHFWVICLVHTLMTMQVDIVANASDATTQSQIDQEHSDAMDRAKADASGLWNRLNSRQTTSTYHGMKVVDAYAGFDSGDLSLFGMFPKVLHLHAGQRVLWHYGQILYEPHSVVFPAKTAAQISNGPPPDCEMAGGADVAPTGTDPNTGMPQCPPGGTPEFELDARVVAKQGDGKVTSISDYENSGARGGSMHPPLGDGPFVLAFPKASPAAGFRYACGVHGKEMTGIVHVA